MKVTRRNFLWQAATIATGAVLLPEVLQAKTKDEVGLQLYTVRELIEKDLKGTLQKIANIGYKNMESAAGSKGHYYGMKPAEFKKLLGDLGMKLRSSHVMVGAAGNKMPFETLLNDTQKLVDMAAESGQEFLTCAYLMPNERTSLDDYKRYVELFNKAGEACNKAGLQFAYHNHDFEFQKMDGQVPMDILLSGVSKDLMKMELDLYWAVKSGNDPVEFFRKNPGRVAMWHVKDMDKTEKKFFTEVGNGSINFKPIFAQAKLSGMKYFFVEQDVTPGNPMDSITTSYRNLTKILV